jgi:hypothetical protein
MANERDLEHYFADLGYDYELLGPRMWLLDTRAGGGAGKVVVSYSPPLVVLRLKVAQLPGDKDDVKLFRLLLEANARELVHGAFGVEGRALVVVDTLDADFVEEEELQAAVDGIALAAAAITPRLKEYGLK